MSTRSRVSLGTTARTGAICPESGVWEVVGTPSTTARSRVATACHRMGYLAPEAIRVAGRRWAAGVARPIAVLSSGRARLPPACSPPGVSHPLRMVHRSHFES